MGQGLLYAMQLVACPSIAMVILAGLVMVVKPPVLLVCSLQHLAAGIVLSAVSVELVPEISEAESNFANIFAIAAGFLFGVGLFVTVGKFCEAELDDCERGHHGEEAKDDSCRGAKALERKTSKVNSMRKSLSHMGSFRQAANYSAIEAGGGVAGPPPPYPFTLVLAVCVDACVDGFLIGISAASGTNAGVIMAIALTIEMGFLSLTFASTLMPQKKHVFLVSCLMPPLTLLLGGFVGATTAAAVAHLPALHVGLISFGIAALLYLVTEELLLEAHEAQPEDEEHIWWIDLQFFLGFLMSFLLDKLL